MTDGIEFSRRGFIATGSTLLATGSSGDIPKLARQVDQPTEFSGAVTLTGPEEARPNPNGPFFAEYGEGDIFAYVYETTDTGERWLITQDTSGWIALTASGTSPWADDDNDDLLEIANHSGIDIGTVRVSDHQHESGTFTMASASDGTETISFTNSYQSDWVCNSVGVDISGGISGVVVAFWANYTTNATGDIDGMNVAWRNETTGDRTARWEVDGMAP